MVDTQRIHDHAIQALSITAGATTVAWLAEFDIIMRIVASTVACLSGIAAIAFYVVSTYKKWKEK